MRNPTVLSSGFLGVNVEMLKRVVQEGAGAVTFKSIGPKVKSGHRNPTVLAYEWGMINAVGLPSPGYKDMEGELARMKEVGAPVFVSIYGASVEEFREVAEAVAGYNPAVIELNVSCPNTKAEGMVFGCSEKHSAEVVAAVKDVAGKVPVMPKLTSQALDVGRVAKACEEAGADAIAAINTVGPGMLINIEAKKPVLDYKRGGISGPAIRPIAVRCVYDIYEVVDIPILGIGGVTEGRDVIELMQAGATAVGIGSGIYYRGIDVFKKVCEEMKIWMKENGYKDVKKLIGVAHE
ncbi:MAG: Dihydroorotate dehydrogenase (NAD(+)), catalytic subunit [Candidatus Fermentimicrarchaeum limneticum]|uniref:Dihydroorotate dehydrogenase n=1 Tax=Fermentimicrarchaeum limneticum TaxID=2795018 RepID=A0A7D6BMD5_FERL1|nr:MAG: Dihydroorotate dehydrogenase (NAD(+)), catalytic subunit [Candidatus Fermentimicrarchaeum limneticum]